MYLTLDVEDRGQSKDSVNDSQHTELTSPPSNQPGIKKKVLHTRTEILIYPNGAMYLGKQQQWFEGTTYHVPKKKKKKGKAVPKTKLNKAEEY